MTVGSKESVPNQETFHWCVFPFLFNPWRWLQSLQLQEEDVKQHVVSAWQAAILHVQLSKEDPGSAGSGAPPVVVLQQFTQFYIMLKNQFQDNADESSRTMSTIDLVQQPNMLPMVFLSTVKLLYKAALTCQLAEGDELFDVFFRFEQVALRWIEVDCNDSSSDVNLAQLFLVNVWRAGRCLAERRLTKKLEERALSQRIWGPLDAGGMLKNELEEFRKHIPKRARVALQLVDEYCQRFDVLNSMESSQVCSRLGEYHRCEKLGVRLGISRWLSNPGQDIKKKIVEVREEVIAAVNAVAKRVMIEKACSLDSKLPLLDVDAPWNWFQDFERWAPASANENPTALSLQKNVLQHWSKQLDKRGSVPTREQLLAFAFLLGNPSADVPIEDLALGAEVAGKLGQIKRISHENSLQQAYLCLCSVIHSNIEAKYKQLEQQSLRLAAGVDRRSFLLDPETHREQNCVTSVLEIRKAAESLRWQGAAEKVYHLHLMDAAQRTLSKDTAAQCCGALDLLSKEVQLFIGAFTEEDLPPDKEFHPYSGLLLKKAFTFNRLSEVESSCPKLWSSAGLRDFSAGSEAAGSAVLEAGAASDSLVSLCQRAAAWHQRQDGGRNDQALSWKLNFMLKVAQHAAWLPMNAEQLASVEQNCSLICHEVTTDPEIAAAMQHLCKAVRLRYATHVEAKVAEAAKAQTEQIGECKERTQKIVTGFWARIEESGLPHPQRARYVLELAVERQQSLVEGDPSKMESFKESMSKIKDMAEAYSAALPSIFVDAVLGEAVQLSNQAMNLHHADLPANPADLCKKLNDELSGKSPAAEDFVNILKTLANRAKHLFFKGYQQEGKALEDEHAAIEKLRSCVEKIWRESQPFVACQLAARQALFTTLGEDWGDADSVDKPLSDLPALKECFSEVFVTGFVTEFQRIFADNTASQPEPRALQRLEKLMSCRDSWKQLFDQHSCDCTVGGFLRLVDIQLGSTSEQSLHSLRLWQQGEEWRQLVRLKTMPQMICEELEQFRAQAVADKEARDTTLQQAVRKARQSISDQTSPSEAARVFALQLQQLPTDSSLSDGADVLEPLKTMPPVPCVESKPTLPRPSEDSKDFDICLRDLVAVARVLAQGAEALLPEAIHRLKIALRNINESSITRPQGAQGRAGKISKIACDSMTGVTIIFSSCTLEAKKFRGMHVSIDLGVPMRLGSVDVCSLRGPTSKRQTIESLLPGLRLVQELSLCRDVLASRWEDLDTDRSTVLSTLNQALQQSQEKLLENGNLPDMQDWEKDVLKEDVSQWASAAARYKSKEGFHKMCCMAACSQEVLQKDRKAGAQLPTLYRNSTHDTHANQTNLQT